MTGFLDRLAERSLGAGASLVRPRATSWFEPSTAAGPLPAPLPPDGDPAVPERPARGREPELAEPLSVSTDRMAPERPSSPAAAGRSLPAIEAAPTAADSPPAGATAERAASPEAARPAPAGATPERAASPSVAPPPAGPAARARSRRAGAPVATNPTSVSMQAPQVAPRDAISPSPAAEPAAGRSRRAAASEAPDSGPAAAPAPRTDRLDATGPHSGATSDSARARRTAAPDSARSHTAAARAAAPGSAPADAVQRRASAPDVARPPLPVTGQAPQPDPTTADRPRPTVSEEALPPRSRVDGSTPPATDTRPSAIAPRLGDAPARGALAPTATAFTDAPPLPRARGAQPAPAREPEVHVTIGRVEVRATAEAASPPRREASRPAPALPLDDYLRHRRTEGRR